MKINKIGRPGYTGYILQGFAESLLTAQEVRQLYTRLLSVPGKIAAFIDRTTIKEAYKVDQWTYFIIDTDNKVFILDY